MKYLKSLIDTSTTNSTKRFIGLTGCFSLIVAMFIFHTPELYYCVATLSGSSLAITGLENIFKK